MGRQSARTAGRRRACHTSIGRATDRCGPDFFIGTGDHRPAAYGFLRGEHTLLATGSIRLDGATI